MGTNDTRRFYDRPFPHYNYYDRQVGGGGTGTGGGQGDSGTLPLSPNLQRLVEDKYKETLLIFNESLARYEGVEGGANKALIPPTPSNTSRVSLTRSWHKCSSTDVNRGGGIVNQGNVHHDLFSRSPPDSNPSPKICKGLLCLAPPPPTLEGEGRPPAH